MFKGTGGVDGGHPKYRDIWQPGFFQAADLIHDRMKEIAEGEGVSVPKMSCAPAS